MKKLIKIFFYAVFFILSFIFINKCNAQIFGTFKGVKYINVDTPADTVYVRENFAVEGFIYYNGVSNKFRAYQDGNWVDLISSSSGEGDFWKTSGMTNLTGTVTIQPDAALSFIGQSDITFFGETAGLFGSEGIQLGGNPIDINCSNTVGNSIVLRRGTGSSFTINSDGAIFTDMVAQYASDYTDQMTNDRDIPDIGWIRDNIGSNFWPLSGTDTIPAGLGSTIRQIGNIIIGNGIGPSSGWRVFFASGGNDFHTTNSEGKNVRIQMSNTGDEARLFMRSDSTASLSGGFQLTLSTENQMFIAADSVVTFDTNHINFDYFEAPVTDNNPTPTEIENACNCEAVNGNSFYIKDTDGSQLFYKIMSNGTNFYFDILSLATEP